MTERNDNLTEVIDGRRGIYGEPTVVFPHVAQVWSGILGTEVKDTDVALLLMGYKLVRTAWAPDYSDNSDDIEGYLDIFRELVGEDMINARSVSEYLAKREERDHPVQMVKGSPEKDVLTASASYWAYQMGLSTHIQNAFDRTGIDTVRDLTNESEESLLKIRNFGVKMLADVKEALAREGLSLRED